MKPALLASALLALPALAPAQTTLLAVESEGLDALVVDARDAGLRRALDVAGARLAGLLESVDAPPPAASALTLLVELAAKPLSLVVALEESGGPPVRVELVVRAADDESAAELLARLDGLLAEGGVPTEIGADGMRAFQAGPLGGGAFGAVDGALVLNIGERAIEAPMLDAADLHPGASAALSFLFDPGAFLSLIQTFAPGEQEVEEMARLLTLMGFGREDGALLTGSIGFDGKFLHSAGRNAGGVEAARRMGTWVDEPLAEADLAMIPADATAALLSKLDLSALLSALAGPEGLGAIEELERELGAELPLEILAHLGTTAGGYASLSSGGGGVQSLVGFVRVADEAALREGLTGLEAQVEQLGATAAAGRVSVRGETIAGVEARVLAFPGLPVPIELTYGIAHGWLIGAASPQAFAAAARQAAGDQGDLRDNPRFLESLPERGRGAWQMVQFLDTPELLREGYGWMTWVSSAVSNALRAPAGEGAVARLLPAYHELARGARASVTVSFADGPDLVSLGLADRSWTANMAGALGLPWTGLMAASMAGSVVMSAMMVPMLMNQAGLAESEQDYAWMQLAQVASALEMYAIENGGKYPASLEELVTPDESGLQYLDQTWVPIDPWGTEIQYIPPVAGGPFELFSLGSDGLPGGVGDAADIHYEH